MSGWDQAREYLARVVPWEPDSWVGIHHTVPNLKWTPESPKHIQKFYWRGKPVKSVDEAVNHLEYLTTKSDAKDIYLCMSSQRDVEIRTHNGREFNAAVRSQPNAVKLKSLFIDLDAKGEDKNSYANINDAAAALAKFIQETGLPKPSLVVASGGGMHVYFSLMRALTPQEWAPLAYALAEAGKQHGLKFDAQCTIDCARVLRIPSTKNFKTATPGVVRIAGKPTDFEYANERLERVLVNYKVATPKVISNVGCDRDMVAFPIRAPLKEPSELSANVDMSKSPPIVLDDVLPECGWLNEIVTTGGKDATNPVWSITTLIATFCEDALAQAHRMGNQHPEYSQESTDILFDRKVKERQAKNLGWPSCAAISATGSKHCQSCKHFPAAKSPLNLAIQGSTQLTGGAQSATTSVTAKSSIATPTGTTLVNSLGVSAPALVQTNVLLTNDLPPGYVNRPNTAIVCEIITDDQGVSSYIPVSDYPMTVGWLQKDPNILHWSTVTDGGNKKDVSIDFGDVGAQSMRGVLQTQGVMVGIGKQVESLTRFLMSWVKKLQETRDSVKSSPFGWTVKSGLVDGFVYGGNLHSPAGASPSANPDPVLQRQYQPTGDIASWVDAATMVTCQGRQDLAAIIASAFAAPLVRFTGQSGVLMSAYSSESGIGKTTALKIAQAVWGDPAQAIQSLNDTQNAVMNKLGEIRNLPLYWDELKTEDDTRKFVNIVFQATVGKEKSRMRSNITQREPGTWQTLLVSASNDSLLDFVVKQTNTTTAGIYRIFEYVVSPAAAGASGQIDTADAALITSKLNDNFGGVGLEYAKYLGSYHGSIALDIKTYLNELGGEVKTRPDERFWLALIACVCVGAGYANKLGFTSFDLVALKKFMLEVLVKMRGEINTQPVDMGKEDNISAMLQQFISAMQARHTLWTNKILKSSGKPPAGYIKLVRHNTNMDGVFVHIGVEDKLMLISSSRLGDWLDDKNYSRHLFVTALKKQFGADKRMGIIGGGTEFKGFKEYLIVLDLGGTNILSEFLQ